MSVFDQEDDQNKDYYTELTGPGGKFDRTKYASDQEMHQAIAKSNVHGSRTIEFKNREFDELRETLIAKTAEANTAAKLDEIIQKYEARVNNNTTNNPNVGDVSPPVIDEAKIEATVEAKIRAIESGKAEKANLDIFDQRLREAHGENAGSVLKDKMNTLGISPEDLKSLAKKSPEAALNTLGLNNKRVEGFQAVPRSSVRTDSFKPEATIRDAVYWEKMRAENMNEYFSPQNSVLRMEDMDNPDFLKRYNERRT